MSSDREVALAEKFSKDVEQIAKDLIVAFALKFKQEVPNLSCPILRWLDFRFRYVAPLPRPVVYSDKFPRGDLPRATREALNKFVKLAESGGDLNPYQGRGLTLRNDFSGANSESRTDLLWADYGIHHFHLSNVPIPTDRYYSLPADYLVFCLVGSNVVAVVDVLPHGEKQDFANPSLIKTVARSWPDYMGQHELKGLLCERELTQAETYQARINGLMLPIAVNGVMHMSPGGGLTSAATSFKVGMASDYLHECLRVLAADVSNENGNFRTPEIRALDVEPEFSLAGTPEGLCVYEKHTAIGFKLPMSESGAEDSPYQTIHSLVFPPWACEHLLKPIRGLDEPTR